MEIFIMIIFAAFLLKISWTDFKTLLIPDKILIPFAAVGIFFDAGNFLVPLDEAIFNAAIIFLLMFIIYKLSRGEMGGGDVKFSAVLALWLGEKIFSAILFASIFAAIFAACLLIKNRDLRKEIPFAPFLSAGSLLAYYL